METGAVYTISEKGQRSGGGEGHRQREHARAAGLVVGEGCVGIGTRRYRGVPYHYLACDMTIEDDGGGRSKSRKNGWEGRKHSVATKQKMRAARRAYWELRRGN